MSSFLTPHRRAVALGALVALIAAGCVAVLLGGCAGSTPTAAQAAPTRTKPLETIFEAQPELFANPGPTLDLLKRLGVDRVKVFMSWGAMSPGELSHRRPAFDAASPAAYQAAYWAGFDTIIRDAKARGLGIDLALEGPAPWWATGPDVPPRTAPGYLGAWQPSAKDYGLFVRAVAERYSGHYKPPGAASSLPKVDFWSIWNEPNYGPNLAPQAVDTSKIEVSPALYRRLVDAAWSALQATGHKHDAVVIGEIAPRGLTVGDVPGNFSGMVPLRFIRALYCVDGSLRPLTGAAATARSCPSTSAGSAAFPRTHPGLFQASGFAFHPYPQGFAPNVRTQGEPDYADLPQLSSLERTLDGAMVAYGSHTQLPLYDTEFGYQTNPPETIARAVSPARAAAWANLGEYMSWRDPRVMSWDQYLLTDPMGSSSFDTGLLFSNGKPKATYDAFRMPIYLPVLTGASGHALEVWGCVRPARSASKHSHKPQVADIQFQPASGGPFKTIKAVTLTDPYGYFDTLVGFPSSGAVRISWSYPHRAGGQQVHSRTVEVTIR
jgi:hypothetical protein